MAIELLDHLVVGTPDLAAARAEFARRTGVEPAEGGQHPDFGTHNALVSLGEDRYLELIAIDPNNASHSGPHPFGLDGLDAPRITTWAIHPSNPDATGRAAAAAGVDPGPFGEGSRRKVCGDLLTWRLTPSHHGEPTGIMPFLIEWPDGVSPAATIGAEAALLAFHAEHPEPELLTPVLAALGTNLPVYEGPVARLVAEVSGPGGSWVIG